MLFETVIGSIFSFLSLKKNCYLWMSLSVDILSKVCNSFGKLITRILSSRSVITLVNNDSYNAAGSACGHYGA